MCLDATVEIILKFFR